METRKRREDEKETKLTADIFTASLSSYPVLNFNQFRIAYEYESLIYFDE